MGLPLYQRATHIGGTPVLGGNDITEYMNTCWKYGFRGHRYPFCKKSNDKGFQGILFMFMQGMHPPFSVHFTYPSWLLIDAGSTFNSICNHQLLRNLSPCLTIQQLSKRGTLKYTQCGSLDLLTGLEVYYNPQSISNLLSVSVAASKYRRTEDIRV